MKFNQEEAKKINDVIVLSPVGVILLTGNTAYHEMDEPKAMRRCRQIIDKVLRLATSRGYKEEKLFREAFRGDDWNARRRCAKRLLEFVSIYDIVPFGGMEVGHAQCN
jgi:hypothetical protein